MKGNIEKVLIENKLNKEYKNETITYHLAACFEEVNEKRNFTW